MENQLITELVKFAIAALGIVGTYALTRLSSFLDAKKAVTVATEGAINYNRALEIAKGLYLLLESEFDGIAQAGLDKKAEMEKRLLEVFPQISAVELAAINKKISDEIKEKIITPILTPAVVEIKVTTDAKPVITTIPQPSDISSDVSKAIEGINSRVTLGVL